MGIFFPTFKHKCITSHLLVKLYNYIGNTHKLSTACIETQSAGTLNDSKNISAAFSLFRRGFRGASVSSTGCSSENVCSWSLLQMQFHIRSISFQSVTTPCSIGQRMLSSPRCSSAFGPTNRSPSRAPAITRTCFGRPIL